MGKWITIAAVLASLGCTNETDSGRALESYGFSDVRYTGYVWFACGKDDFSHTGFTANNAAGHPVSGVVCCGLLFKACTVRF